MRRVRVRDLRPGSRWRSRPRFPDAQVLTHVPAPAAHDDRSACMASVLHPLTPPRWSQTPPTTISLSRRLRPSVGTHHYEHRQGCAAASRARPPGLRTFLLLHTATSVRAGRSTPPACPLGRERLDPSLPWCPTVLSLRSPSSSALRPRALAVRIRRAARPHSPASLGIGLVPTHRSSGSITRHDCSTRRAGTVRSRQHIEHHLRSYSLRLDS